MFGLCFVVGKRQNHVCVFNPGFCGNFMCLRTKMLMFYKFCICENFDEASCCKRGVARFSVVVERVKKRRVLSFFLVGMFKSSHL